MRQGFTEIGGLSRTRSVPDLRDLELERPKNALSRELKGVASFAQSCQDLSTVGKTADDVPAPTPAPIPMPTAIKKVHSDTSESELESESESDIQTDTTDEPDLASAVSNLDEGPGEPEDTDSTDLQEIADVIGMGTDPTDEAEPAPANDPAADPSADPAAAAASDPAQPSPGEKLTAQFSREMVVYLFRNRSDATELLASWENTPGVAASKNVLNFAAIYKAASDKVDADTTLTQAEKVAALAKLDAVAEKYVACIKKDGLGEKSAFGAYHAGHYEATKERQKLEKQLGELSGGRTAAGAQALRAQVLDKHVYPFILKAFEERHGVNLDITAEALVRIMLDYQAKIALDNVVGTYDEISAKNDGSIRSLANVLLLMTTMPDLLREIRDEAAKAAAQAAASGTPGPGPVPGTEPAPEEAAETESIGEPDFVPGVPGPAGYDEVDGGNHEAEADAVETDAESSVDGSEARDNIDDGYDTDDESDDEESWTSIKNGKIAAGNVLDEGYEAGDESDEDEDTASINGEVPANYSLKTPKKLSIVEQERRNPGDKSFLEVVEFKRDATATPPLENPMSVKDLIAKYNQPGAVAPMPKYGWTIGSHGDDKPVELTRNRRTEHRFYPDRPPLNPLFSGPPQNEAAS
jgi:hypothetical protein